MHWMASVRSFIDFCGVLTVKSFLRIEGVLRFLKKLVSVYQLINENNTVTSVSLTIMLIRYNKFNYLPLQNKL